MAIEVKIVTSGDAALKQLQTDFANMKKQLDELTAAQETNSKSRKKTTDGVKEETTLLGKLNAIRKEEKAEQRLQNFVMNQGREIMGAAALALTTFGIASGEMGTKTKKISDSANQGFLAFQGLSFALNAVPYGQLIAGAFAATVAIKGMVTVTDEERAKAIALGLSIAELQFKLNAIRSRDYAAELANARKAAEQEANLENDKFSKLQDNLNSISNYKRMLEKTDNQALVNEYQMQLTGLQAQTPKLQAEWDKANKTYKTEKGKAALEATLKEYEFNKSGIDKQLLLYNQDRTSKLNSFLATNKDAEAANIKQYNDAKKTLEQKLEAELYYAREAGKTEASLNAIKEDYAQRQRKLSDDSKDTTAKNNDAVKQETLSMQNSLKLAAIDNAKSIEELGYNTAKQKIEIDRKYTIQKLEEEDKQYKDSGLHSAKLVKQHSEMTKQQVANVNKLADATLAITEKSGRGALYADLKKNTEELIGLTADYNVELSKTVRQWREMGDGMVAYEGTYGDLLKHISEEIRLLTIKSVLLNTTDASKIKLDFENRELAAIANKLEAERLIVETSNKLIPLRKELLEITDKIVSSHGKLTAEEYEKLRVANNLVQLKIAEAEQDQKSLETSLLLYNVNERLGIAKSALNTLYPNEVAAEKLKMDYAREQLSFYKQKLAFTAADTGEKPEKREAAKAALVTIDTTESEGKKKQARDTNDYLYGLSLNAAQNYRGIAQKELDDKKTAEIKAAQDMFTLGRLTTEQLEKAKKDIQDKYRLQKEQSDKEAAMLEIDTAVSAANTIGQAILSIATESANSRTVLAENERTDSLRLIQERQDAEQLLLTNQLANQYITAADRVRLEAQQVALTKKNEAEMAKAKAEADIKVRDAKGEAWKAEHRAKLLMATADAAHAAIVALTGGPPPFNLLAAAVTAGAAAVQLGIIASQEMPRFHTGGVIGQNPLASDERLVVGQVGETVRTKKQEAELSTNTRSTSAIVNVHFNGPVDRVEYVKQAIQEGLRQSNLTISEYAVNQSGKITL